MVILEAWLKSGSSESSVGSVGLWMGIVVDPLRVLWHSGCPRVHLGTAVGGVGWLA